VAVLGLVAVVAIAAGGSVAPGSNVSRPPAHALIDAIFTLFLLALAAGAVLLVYGLMQRKAIAQELASGRYRRMTLLAYVVYFAVVVGFSYWRLAHWRAHHTGLSGSDLGLPTPSTGSSLPADSSYTPGISWLSVIVVVGLVVAAGMAYLSAERRARRASRDEPLLAAQLADALDEALDDLRAETDPRRAVVAAYARMERVLAANGVARRDSETPEEYLRRALDDLPPSSGAIERLTSLYTRAKFSQHEIDPVMKGDAIAALEHLRDELRLASATPSPREPRHSSAGASA
jgi:heme exporter protein D